jgi:hypothetical protein
MTSIQSESKPTTSPLVPSDPSKPFVSESSKQLDQMKLDSTYDLQFQTQPPKVIQMGGKEDVYMGPIECWVHPKTDELYWIQWVSERAKHAEEDSDFVQMFFYWLPVWLKKGKKSIPYPMGSKTSFLTLEVDNENQKNLRIR